MAHEVPLIVRLPVLVVAEELSIYTPRASSVPLAAVPVIVTLPEPVDEILADDETKTPLESDELPHDVPLIVRLPEFVVTQAELLAKTPKA